MWQLDFTTQGDVQATLDADLRAAANCQAQYEEAPGHVRRLINQGFLKRLYIGPDGHVERYELTEPFATLLHEGHVTTSDASRPSQDALDESNAGNQEDTTVHEPADGYDALDRDGNASGQTWPVGVLERTFWQV